MQVEINLIAKKYAVAFINTFFDQVSNDNLKKWIKLEKFLKTNRLFYVYLNIPKIPELTKKKALIKIAHSIGLQKPIQKIMFLLLDHGRIEILDNVINKIILCYRQRKNTQMFRITTSHDITDKEKEKIITFLKSISKKEIVTNFIKDEKLICGLRIQSNTFLWERSVAKQLRDVKRSIFKQVGLW